MFARTNAEVKERGDLSPSQRDEEIEGGEKGRMTKERSFLLLGRGKEREDPRNPDTVQRKRQPQNRRGLLRGYLEGRGGEKMQRARTRSKAPGGRVEEDCRDVLAEDGSHGPKPNLWCGGVMGSGKYHVGKTFSSLNPLEVHSRDNSWLPVRGR